MPTNYDNYTALDQVDKNLLDNDIHYLSGEICEENIALAIKWILSANISKKPKRTLKLYVNSTGGDLYEAFGLIDVMKNSYHPVSTIGLGAVMSAAFLIFASGKQGQRYVGKNTGVMCHQFSTSMEDKMHDIKAQMKENQNCEMRELQILREATGMTINETRKKFINQPSDQYYTAKQLVELGIADHIL
jgi:ATP-dependent Clp protease protease subunit